MLRFPALGRDGRVNALIGAGHFLSHFYQLCLPTMFIAWQRVFDVSFAELGLTMALMSGAAAMMQTPMGFLVDRHGARPFLIGGTLLMSLSIATMGLTTAFWQVLVLATLSGIGNSVIHPADYAILAGRWMSKNLGRSFALHTFIGNLGFSAAPPVTALCAAVGWRGALLSVGLLGLPVVASILLQSRMLGPGAGGAAARPPASGGTLLPSRSVLLFFAFFMLSAMAGAGIQSWLVTILHQGTGWRSRRPRPTGYMIGSTCGTLVGGWIADRNEAPAVSSWC